MKEEERVIPIRVGFEKLGVLVERGVSLVVPAEEAVIVAMDGGGELHK